MDIAESGRTRRRRWRSRRRRGTGRPGFPRSESESGSVTAETAVALPSLALVLGAALWAIAAVGARLECVDAARAGARAAARGEALEVVRRFAGRAAPPGAVVSITRDAELSRVTVSATIRPSWAVGMPPVHVAATATSATEGGVDDLITEARQAPTGVEPE
ncbi:TadE family type IV pilus minor pilin [Sphaerisporangium sp. NPDC005289]|uniref:TadE family type IV pilus minor pilin n=1 Tax=Sphaerisporangium sp. NPDC005289 TaxID=3155247 RepID=UPI0033BE39A7